MTVRDLANEFVRRGTGASATMAPKHLPAFFEALLDLGVRIAKRTLRHVDDPELRKALEAVLMGATSGALLGAMIGSPSGPKGAAIGAGVGAVVGGLLALASVQMSVTWVDDGPPDRPRRVRVAVIN